MRYLTLVFVLGWFLEVKSQDFMRIDSIQPILKDEKKPVYTIVEQMPTFPGGEKELNSYIQSIISYPKYEEEKGVEGRVIVGFVVDASGKVRDATVKKGVSEGLDKEALRIISLLPDFNPGRQQGKAVNVMYVLPIKFKLDSKNKLISFAPEVKFESENLNTKFQTLTSIYTMCLDKISSSNMTFSPSLKIRFFVDNNFAPLLDDFEKNYSKYNMVELRECIIQFFKNKEVRALKEAKNRYYTFEFK